MATGTMNVGTVHVECPECHTIIPVPVTAGLIPGDGENVNLACTPDMTDLWAHMWTHDE